MRPQLTIESRLTISERLWICRKRVNERANKPLTKIEKGDDVNTSEDQESKKLVVLKKSEDSSSKKDVRKQERNPW